jgi:hypothetical protein
VELNAVKVEPKLMDKLADSVKAFVQIGGKHYHITNWPPELLELVGRDVAPRDHRGSGPQIYASRSVAVVVASDLGPHQLRFQLDIAVVNDQVSPAALTWLEALVDGHVVPVKQFVVTTSDGRVPAQLRFPLPLQPRTTERYCAEFEADLVGVTMADKLTSLQVVASVNETNYRSSQFTVLGSRIVGETLRELQPDLKGPLAIDLPMLWLPTSEIALTS